MPTLYDSDEDLQQQEALRHKPMDDVGATPLDNDEQEALEGIASNYDDQDTEDPDQKDSEDSLYDEESDEKKPKKTLRQRVTNKKNMVVTGITASVVSLVVAGVMSLPGFIITQWRELIGKVSNVSTSQQLRYTRNSFFRTKNLFSKEGRALNRLEKQMKPRGYTFTYASDGSIESISRYGQKYVGEEAIAQVATHLEETHPLKWSRYRTAEFEAIRARVKVTSVSPVDDLGKEVTKETADEQVNKTIAKSVLEGEDGKPISGLPPSTDPDEAAQQEQLTRDATTPDDAVGGELDLEQAKKDALEGKPVVEAAKDVVTGAERGSLKVTGFFSRIKLSAATWVKDQVKSVFNPVYAISKICSLKDNIYNGFRLARYKKAIGLIRYTAEILAVADSIRTGNVNPLLLASVMQRIVKANGDGKFFNESEGLQSVLKGKYSKSKNSATKGFIQVDGQPSGTMGAIADGINNTPTMGEDGCKVYKNTGVQIAAGLTNLLPGAGRGAKAAADGTTEVVKLSVTAAIKNFVQKTFSKQALEKLATKEGLKKAGLGSLNVAGGVAVGLTVELSIEQMLEMAKSFVAKANTLNFTAQEQGLDLADISFAGGGATDKELTLLNGGTPATPEEYSQAEVDYIAWKKEENSKKNMVARLFNKDTFVNATFAALPYLPMSLNQIPSMLLSDVRLAITNIITLKPFAMASNALFGTSAYAADDDLVSFETQTLKNGEKIAVDFAGNPKIIIRNDIANKDVDKNIEELIALNEIDANTLEPIGEGFKKHMATCKEAIDITSAIEDGKGDCLARNEITKKYEALLLYRGTKNAFLTQTGSDITESTNPTPASQQGTFIWPLGNTADYVSACWNDDRTGYKAGYYHSGLDIHAVDGEQVMAAGDGKVVVAKNTYSDTDTGKTIILEHAGGIFTQYQHLKQIDVTVGQTVKQGNVIGTADSTGFSTSTHLHFNVQRQGTISTRANQTLNPLDYLPIDGREMSYVRNGSFPPPTLKGKRVRCVPSSTNQQGWVVVGNTTPGGGPQ